MRVRPIALSLKESKPPCVEPDPWNHDWIPDYDKEGEPDGRVCKKCGTKG